MNTRQLISIVGATLLVAGCTSAPMQPGNGEDLAVCGSFPNCVVSVDKNSSAYIKPLSANLQQWQALKQTLGQQDDWQIIINDESFIQAVVTTATMRFKDDVQLQFVAADETIQVRSSSRLGYSDMGANAARVEGLRETLEML
jgi:uncharacterized protein (DUF1499 family)